MNEKVDRRGETVTYGPLMTEEQKLAVERGATSSTAFAAPYGAKEIKANDMQVGGNHYMRGTGKCLSCGTELQHWDLVAMFHWDYFQGQIVKYLMRWQKKNGIEDLKKARHYLNKYIELEEKNSNV